MKQIDKILENLTQCDMSYSMRNAAESAVVLHLHREQLEKFFALEPDACIKVTGSSISLRYPERTQMLNFLQSFGGDWKKEVNDYDKTKMDYVQEHLHPLRDKARDFEDEEYEDANGQYQTRKVPAEYIRKLVIKVESVSPPPSCVIVEEDVEIPARIEKRKRIVCKDDEKPVESPVTTE